jgi:hypothetical protein
MESGAVLLSFWQFQSVYEQTGVMCGCETITVLILVAVRLCCVNDNMIMMDSSEVDCSPSTKYIGSKLLEAYLR